MYATTVGLVLSGYHSLDERNLSRAPYEQEEQPVVSSYYAAPQSAPVAAPAPTPAPAEVRATVPRRPGPRAAACQTQGARRRQPLLQRQSSPAPKGC